MKSLSAPCRRQQTNLSDGSLPLAASALPAALFGFFLLLRLGYLVYVRHSILRLVVVCQWHAFNYLKKTTTTHTYIHTDTHRRAAAGPETEKRRQHRPTGCSILTRFAQMFVHVQHAPWIPQQLPDRLKLVFETLTACVNTQESIHCVSIILRIQNKKENCPTLARQVS